MIRKRNQDVWSHHVNYDYCFICCVRNLIWMSIRIPVFGIFFQVSATCLQFLHSPAYDKPMLEGGKAQFHFIIDLSDKNLINLLYKLLKQSKRNELTWYIQHWLLLYKNWMSALSATTAVIQFFRNTFFPLISSPEIVQLKMYFRQNTEYNQN